MVRISVIFAGCMALMLPCSAQTPPVAEPYSFLPADTRVEYRTELTNSAWARRLRSAAGWVVISTSHSVTEMDKRFLPNRCFGEFPGSEPGFVRAIRDDLHEIRILPGNLTEDVQRLRVAHCLVDYLKGPLQSFEVSAPTADEIKQAHAYDDKQSIYLQPASVSLDPHSLVQAPGIEQLGSQRIKNQTKSLKLWESDPELKAGTTLRFEVSGTENSYDEFSMKLVGSSDWHFTQTCRIDRWAAIGEGENVLPFKAAIGSCQPIEEVVVPGLQFKDVTFAIVPELDWHVGLLLSPTSHWNIIKEAPGRWRVTFQGSAEYRVPKSWLLLSPEAAPNYLPKGN
jgi:hypothetical protein